MIWTIYYGTYHMWFWIRIMVDFELITQTKVKYRSTDFCVYVQVKRLYLCLSLTLKLELASPFLFLPCIMMVMELTKFHEPEWDPTDSDSSSESEQDIKGARFDLYSILYFSEIKLESAHCPYKGATLAQNLRLITVPGIDLNR